MNFKRLGAELIDDEIERRFNEMKLFGNLHIFSLPHIFVNVSVNFLAEFRCESAHDVDFCYFLTEISFDILFTIALSY